MCSSRKRNPAVDVRVPHCCRRWCEQRKIYLLDQLPTLATDHQEHLAEIHAELLLGNRLNGCNFWLITTQHKVRINLWALKICCNTSCICKRAEFCNIVCKFCTGRFNPPSQLLIILEHFILCWVLWGFEYNYSRNLHNPLEIISRNIKTANDCITFCFLSGILLFVQKGAKNKRLFSSGHNI